MLSTAIATMYPAANRGCTETDRFRIYSTLNAGSTYQQGRDPVGPLYVLDDETLAGRQETQLMVKEASLILLLPLVGGLEIMSGTERLFIEAGQVQLLVLGAGSEFTVGNPYEENLVNYLQLWFRSPAALQADSGRFSFDIEGDKNSLVPLFPAVEQNGFFLRAFLGKFGGRREVVHRLSANRTALAFVVQGAFEIESRLLEERDGLALFATDDIEVEALSNEAIVLLLEMEG